MDDDKEGRRRRQKGLRSSVFRAAPSYASNPFLGLQRSEATVGGKPGEESFVEHHPGGSYLESLYEEAHRLFIKFIPHDYIKSLPPRYLYSLATLCYLIIASIAAYFFFSAYFSERSRLFLSTAFAPGLCTIVQKPADGVFLADIYGHWQGTSEFVSSKAVYKVTLRNFTAQSYHSSSDKYAELMSSLSNLYEGYLKPTFESQNLPHNLAFMANYVASAEVLTLDGSSNQQTFEMTGEANVIFDLDFVSAGLGDWFGHCDVESSVTYSSSTYQWGISWNYAAYMNSSVCSRILRPSDVGFVANPRLQNQQFELEIDVRSFMALVGVNAPFNDKFGQGGLGEIYFSGVLRRIHGANFTFEGYDIARYYDYRYPGMHPLICITPTGSVATGPRSGKCLYDFGGISFGIPYFEHFGVFKDMSMDYPQSLRKPVACNCSQSEAHGMYGSTDLDKLSYGFKNCQSFDFLHGFLIYRLNQDAHARHIIHMLFNVTNKVGESTLDERGYEAAWHSVPHIAASKEMVYTSLAAPNMSARQRAEAFEFCSTPWGNCSLLMLRTTSGLAATERLYSINSNYVQMPNSSCNFEIVSSGAFAKLKSNAPVPLQEKYYVCTSSSQDALYTAAGTAFGNTAIAVSVAITVFIHCLLVIQYATGLFIPRTYMQEEKQEILDGIAVKFLVLRDQRHKEEHGDQHNLLHGFLSELQRTHEQDNVYFVRKSPADESRKKRAEQNWSKTLQMLSINRKTADRPPPPPKLSVAGEMEVNPMITGTQKLSELTHTHMPKILEMGRLRSKTGGGGEASAATPLDDIPLPQSTI